MSPPITKPENPERWLRRELKRRLQPDIYNALMQDYAAHRALYRRWMLARNNRRTLEGLFARRMIASATHTRRIQAQIEKYKERIRQDEADGYTKESLQ